MATVNTGVRYVFNFSLFVPEEAVPLDTIVLLTLELDLFEVRFSDSRPR